LAAVAFAGVMLIVGWLAGGRAPETRRSFAITATARNLGLGLVIAGQISGHDSLQLALLAIWLMCFVTDVVFAVAARGHRPPLQTVPVT
jgi:predicted Na+-dependent transporter